MVLKIKLYFRLETEMKMKITGKNKDEISILNKNK